MHHANRLECHHKTTKLKIMLIATKSPHHELEQAHHAAGKSINARSMSYPQTSTLTQYNQLINMVQYANYRATARTVLSGATKALKRRGVSSMNSSRASVE